MEANQEQRQDAFSVEEAKYALKAKLLTAREDIVLRLLFALQHEFVHHIKVATADLIEAGRTADEKAEVIHYVRAVMLPATSAMLPEKFSTRIGRAVANYMEFNTAKMMLLEARPALYMTMVEIERLMRARHEEIFDALEEKERKARQSYAALKALKAESRKRFRRLVESGEGTYEELSYAWREMLVIDKEFNASRKLISSFHWRIKEVINNEDSDWQCFLGQMKRQAEQLGLSVDERLAETVDYVLERLEGRLVLVRAMIDDDLTQWLAEIAALEGAEGQVL